MILSQQLQYQFLPIWIGTLIVIILAVIFVLLEFDYLGPVFVVFGVMAIIVSTLTALPFNGRYMVIDHIRGTITATNAETNNYNTVGDNSPVLQLDGKPLQYQIDDSRLLTYRVGQEVHLSCTVQWNPGSRDQWNCGLDN